MHSRSKLQIPVSIRIFSNLLIDLVENREKFLNLTFRNAENNTIEFDLEKAMTPFLPSGPGLLQGLFRRIRQKILVRITRFVALTSANRLTGFSHHANHFI